jgi:hypothetical protein
MDQKPILDEIIKEKIAKMCHEVHHRNSNIGKKGG